MMMLQVRTRKGRKKKPRLVRGLTRYIVLACVIFGTAFVYVKQRNTVTRMGYDINVLKQRDTDLAREHGLLEIELTELKRPDRIREEIRREGLNLREVENDQKITLYRPMPMEIIEPEEGDRPVEATSNDETRLVRR
jgi:hypothetical protein